MSSDDNTVNPFLFRWPSKKGTIIWILALVNLILLVTVSWWFNTADYSLIGFPGFIWMVVILSLIPTAVMWLAMRWEVGHVPASVLDKEEGQARGSESTEKGEEN